MTTESASFNQNYKILKEIAEKLRDQENTDDPNIDDLLPMVEKATKAYRVCKSRLEAVEKALAEMEADKESFESSD